MESTKYNSIKPQNKWFMMEMNSHIMTQAEKG